MFNITSLASGYGQSEVIHDINLKVDKQEIVAVMGRNGMGKTTLFKTLMGILPMRHGSITVDGRELSGMESHQRVASGVAYVPQGRMIFPSMTVLENIQTGLPAAAGGKVPDELYALFPVLYIGLPLGALAAVRLAGRDAVALLAVGIIVSDSGQYYSGRTFGRHLLAPAISPKKTVEGAIGGVVLGSGAMVLGGLKVFPTANLTMLVLMSAAVVAAGIVGDLFESLLKRSAGVKDSSSLIPGHGGVLDRIDSWLFAGPVFYVFVRYL